MRILFLAALIGAFLPRLSAQDVQWGSPFDVREGFRQFIGTLGGDHYYLTQRERKNRYIQRISANLDAADPVNIELNAEQGLRDYVDAAIIGERLYVFSQYNDRREKKLYLYADELDPQTLKIRDQTNIEVIDYPSIKETGEFRVLVSLDAEMLMVFSDRAGKPKENKAFAVQVYDPELNSKWENKFTLPLTNELFQFQDVFVSGDAEVFLGYLAYDKRPGSGKDGELYYRAHVMHITGNGDVAVDHMPDFGTALVNEFRLAEHQYGGAALIGHFSYKEDRRMAGTVFCSVFDAVQDVEVNPLSHDELFRFMKPSQEEQARKDISKGRPAPELRDFVMRDVLVRPTGEVVGILEFWDRVDEMPSGTVDFGVQLANVGNNSWIMRDVMVVQYGDLGRRQFVACVPKRQLSTTEDDFFGSVGYAAGKENLYFVYNDHKLNLNKERSGAMAKVLSTNNCVVTLATIDRNGIVTRTHLDFPTGKARLCRPGSCGQWLWGPTFMVYARDRSNRYVGTISIR